MHFLLGKLDLAILVLKIYEAKSILILEKSIDMFLVFSFFFAEFILLKEIKEFIEFTLIYSRVRWPSKILSIMEKSVPIIWRAIKNFSVSSGFHFSAGCLFRKLKDDNF
jgi:hypothetical protein